MALESTGAMPLDEGPLSPEEIQALRAELREADRRRWIVRRVRLWGSIVAGAAVTAWAFGEWVLRFITITLK